MVRSEIGGQKAKSQIPDLFPDMEFPNLFHLKEHKILMNLKKKVILLPIRGAEESTKTFWATWINSKQFFKNGPNLSQCLFFFVFCHNFYAHIWSLVKIIFIIFIFPPR